MKKLLLFLLIFTLGHACIAQETSYLQAEISFNWDTISQQEREENIEQIKASIFTNPPEKKIKFKKIYQDYLKDKNYKTHYMVASAGYKEYKEYNISAMYVKRISSLYMYALQSKNDLATIYYYDALGNLRYIDNITGNYPTFPYYTKQYRRGGSLAGISYFTNKDTQYIFKSNGEFKGVWHKENFYDEKGKIIMKRSNY